jgi:monoamine oxidase
VKQCEYAPTCKLGWQANERFWESDKNQIYGGISYTDDPITQMWYPSYDYFTKNGTLTGVYNYDDDAKAFGKMSLEERIITARQGAIKLHPEFADTRLVPSDKAISIAWQNIRAKAVAGPTGNRAVRRTRKPTRGCWPRTAASTSWGIRYLNSRAGRKAP